jgi:protein arginine kinase activator
MICQKCHQNEATVFISQTINQETTQMHLCAQCAGEQGPGFNITPYNLHPFGDFGDFLNDIVAQAQQMGEQIAQNLNLDPALLKPGASIPMPQINISLGSMPPGGQPGMGKAPLRQAAGVPTMQCPHCGYQFETFRQTGRLGCTRCYESFKQVLQPLISSIHGNVKHVEGDAVETTETTSSSAEAIVGKPVDESAAKPGKKETLHPQGAKLRELRAQLKDAVKNERFEDAARLRDEIHAMEETPHGV